MENTIRVLKRSNGMFGIYVNGCEQKNLVSNASLKDSAESLINRLILEVAARPDAKIVFTDNESEFECKLPSLQECVDVK